METATNVRNERFLIRDGVLAGVIATVTMDYLSALVHQLGLTAPLTPNLIGRWFASILRLRPFHPDSGKSGAGISWQVLGFDLKEARDDSCGLLPVAGLRLQLFAARYSKAIEAGAAVVFRCTPSRNDGALMLKLE